jgi:hypothetical protein
MAMPLERAYDAGREAWYNTETTVDDVPSVWSVGEVKTLWILGYETQKRNDPSRMDNSGFCPDYDCSVDGVW